MEGIETTGGKMLSIRKRFKEKRLLRIILHRDFGEDKGINNDSCWNEGETRSDFARRWKMEAWELWTSAEKRTLMDKMLKQEHMGENTLEEQEMELQVGWKYWN